MNFSGHFTLVLHNIKPGYAGVFHICDTDLQVKSSSRSEASLCQTVWGGGGVLNCPRKLGI
jgi:hypothetical protein